MQPWKVCEWGSSGALSINFLALHGFGGAGEDFSSLASSLAPGRAQWRAPTVVYHAGAPWESALGRVLPQLHSVIPEAWPTTQPILLGYSMGARLALHFALQYPKSTRAIILVGGTPGVVDHVERSVRRAQDEALAERILQDGVEAFEAFWRRQPLIATQSQIPEKVLKPMMERRLNNKPEVLASTLMAFSQGVMPPVWDRLSEIQCPVLLAVGERDEKYKTIAQSVVDHIPQADLCILPNAGHAAHLENEPAFMKCCEKFINKLEAN